MFLQVLSRALLLANDTRFLFLSYDVNIEEKKSTKEKKKLHNTAGDKNN